jgi:membrane protein DedA with SNARE-associated domain
MSFTELATGLIDQLGVWGIGLGVFLNGLGVPGISEVLLPLGGVAVKRGLMSGPALFAVAMICQLAGTALAYVIARNGGLPFIERYGKYVLISTRELDAAERAFQRYGSWLVLFGAFVPGIQGFVGYVGGIAKMNFVRFIISVAIGKVVWIGGLMALGMLLGDHLDLIDRYVKQVGMVVLAALVVAGVLYVRRHRARQREEKA